MQRCGLGAGRVRSHIAIRNHNGGGNIKSLPLKQSFVSSWRFSMWRVVSYDNQQTTQLCIESLKSCLGYDSSLYANYNCTVIECNIHDNENM